MNVDKEIILTGGEQIIVMMKHWFYGSWKKFEKDERKKLSKGYPKSTKESAKSWLEGIKKVREIERKYKVRFVLKETLDRGEKIFYKNVN